MKKEQQVLKRLLKILEDRTVEVGNKLNEWVSIGDRQQASYYKGRLISFIEAQAIAEDLLEEYGKELGTKRPSMP